MQNRTPSSEFLDLFTKSQLRLYRYIVLLVADRVGAEDVLQNTNLVMLRKCDQFLPGSNFHSWSTRIAYLEALKYRSSRKRQSPGLSKATLEMLSAEAVEYESLLDRRNAALPECMEKLGVDDLSLVSDHYFRGLSWEKIAESLGRSSSSVRHSICRIRRELKRCIDAVVAREEDA
ncbi:MAG: sigma-70 family RNA polymerase sigma factor [Pirellulales bacterium]|nr:sigma-70 family RNA polymerase sigma factor [Pirellulales bacterium]